MFKSPRSNPSSKKIRTDTSNKSGWKGTRTQVLELGAREVFVFCVLSVIFCDGWKGGRDGQGV